MRPFPSLRIAAVAAALLAVSDAPLAGQEPLSWEEMQEALPDHVPGTQPLRIAYGAEADQFGVLRLPPGPGPFPVALIIHGGCWLSIADYRYLEPLTAALNEAGWATWSLEFRRIDTEGGAWPGILRDVADGVDHLRALAGSRPLDLDRVVALGHSSGGHLALWAALRSRVDEAEARREGLWRAAPLDIRGVVGLAPITDLDDYRGYTRCGPTIVSDFLSGDPRTASPEGGTDESGGAGVPEALPSREEERRQSLSDPARLVPSDVPQLLLLGQLDEVVPPAHGRAYLERAARTGQVAEMRTIPGAGHFELVAPWTPGWRDVAPILLGWMEERAPGS